MTRRAAVVDVPRLKTSYPGLHVSLSWTIQWSAPDAPPSLGEFPDVSTAAAALEVFDRVGQAVPGGDFLVRIQDPDGEVVKFLDVGVCEWGWILIWSDQQGTFGGDAFGTFRGGESETRLFAQPGGDDLEFDRAWFVGESDGRRAVGVYVRTGKLWKGVVWWPDPPAVLLVE